MTVDPQVRADHIKRIRAAATRLERARVYRDRAILAAFEAGLAGADIYQPAGLSKARIYQIREDQDAAR